MAATVIPRTQNDLYLKALFDRRIPLRFRFNRQEYTLVVISDSKNRLWLRADRPLTGLLSGSRLDLFFDFFGMRFQFIVKAKMVLGKFILADREVDFLRKDLERSFVRIAAPASLRASLVFQEERYALNFPRIGSYEPVRPPPHRERPMGVEQGRRDLKSVLQDLNAWAASAADGVKTVIFRDTKPEGLEERLTAKTGLMLYIPSPEEGPAQEEAGPEERLLTRKHILRDFEGQGYEAAAAAELLEDILRRKAERGIYSDMWAPIRFQEYVLGYVRVWTVDQRSARGGKAPLDYQAVETVREFTKGIAYAFQDGGRLESRRVREEACEVRVLDISASGLRFCYPPSKPGLSLPVGMELGVTLETPGRRRVRTRVEIVRRVAGRVEMGGRFLGPATDDQRVFFEYLYGGRFSPERSHCWRGRCE